MHDGTEREIGSGDVLSIPAGHDAEVVGGEPCVMLDIGEEDADYAKRAEGGRVHARSKLLGTR